MKIIQTNYNYDKHYDVKIIQDSEIIHPTFVCFYGLTVPMFRNERALSYFILRQFHTVQYCINTIKYLFEFFNRR